MRKLGSIHKHFAQSAFSLTAIGWGMTLTRKGFAQSRRIQATHRKMFSGSYPEIMVNRSSRVAPCGLFPANQKKCVSALLYKANQSACIIVVLRKPATSAWRPPQISDAQTLSASGCLTAFPMLNSKITKTPQDRSLLTITIGTKQFNSDAVLRT